MELGPVLEVFLSAAHARGRTWHWRADLGGGGTRASTLHHGVCEKADRGADGGTIATRTDMVRTKDQDERPRYDTSERRHALWTLCRLSKHALAPPVMADALGQLYNKDALLEFLLQRGAGDANDAHRRVAGHVRGMRDATEIRLTRNPVPPREEDGTQYYPYACPLTQRPMNGRHAFVFLPCGCVFSETGLRHVATAGRDDRAQCPQCAAPFRAAYDPKDVECDVTWLNPTLDVQAARREQLAARRKRKAGAHAARPKRT